MALLCTGASCQGGQSPVPMSCPMTVGHGSAQVGPAGPSLCPCSVCPAGPSPTETAQLWFPGTRTPDMWRHDAQPGLGALLPPTVGPRGSQQGPTGALFGLSLPTLSSAGTALPKFPPTQSVLFLVLNALRRNCYLS